MADITISELRTAWWKWVEEGCPSRAKRKRGIWMRENVFTYDGTAWVRDTSTTQSNSRKTTYTTFEIFKGADGRIVSEDSGRPLNRNNDPKRNWGLPD